MIVSRKLVRAIPVPEKLTLFRLSRQRCNVRNGTLINSNAGLHTSLCCHLRYRNRQIEPDHRTEFKDSLSITRTRSSTNDGLRSGLAERGVDNKYVEAVARTSASLKRDTRPESPLDVVNESMKEDEVVDCVRSLLGILQTQPSSIKESLAQDPRFHRLAHNMLSKGRYLNADELVDVLALLTALNVSSSSRVVLTTLQLLRHHINRLDIYKIVKLNTLLYPLRGTQLARAISSALPVVFATHLNYQLGPEKTYKLNNLLVYACNNGLSEAAVSSIIHQLTSVSKEMDAIEALGTLGCLALVKHPDTGWSRLWQRCVRKVFGSFDELPKEDICKTLKRIAQGFSGNKYVYHEQLLDAVGKRAVQENWDSRLSISVARSFKRLSHYHGDLLDYISKYIHEETTAADDLIHILGIFGWFGVPFPSLESTTEKLLEVKGLNSRDASTVSIVTSSVFAGNRNSRMLQRALMKENIDLFLNEDEGMAVTNRLQMLARLYQAKQLYANDVEVTLQEDLLHRADKALREGSRDSVLLPLLNDVLGGPSFVLDKVRVLPWKKVHSRGLCSLYADFIISIDEVGNPVEVREMASVAEDDQIKWEITEILPNTIAVLSIRAAGLLNNIDKLKGPFAFDVNLLKAAGLRVLPISIPYLEDMADIERAPYLLRRIHEVRKLQRDHDLFAS